VPRGRAAPKASSARKTSSRSHHAGKHPACIMLESTPRRLTLQNTLVIDDHAPRIRPTGIEMVALRLLTSITVMSSPKPFPHTWCARRARA